MSLSLVAPATSGLLEKWDPRADAPPSAPVPKRCMQRIGRDLKDIAAAALPGILVCPAEENVLVVHAVIIGTAGTPYAGGFFHFMVSFPDTYPDTAPKVALLTTGGGKVRFGPNLYANGKVCLSILGTWHGDAWTAAMTLSSVLLSIQGLIMNAEPFRNEPGYESTTNVEAVRRYNALVAHETLRVAVVDTVQRILPREYQVDAVAASAGVASGAAAVTAASSVSAAGGGVATDAAAGGRGGRSLMPEGVREGVLESFLQLATAVYPDVVAQHARACDGRPYADPYWQTNTGTFAFAALGARVAALVPAVQRYQESVAAATAAEEDGAEG